MASSGFLRIVPPFRRTVIDGSGYAVERIALTPARSFESFWYGLRAMVTLNDLVLEQASVEIGGQDVEQLLDLRGRVTFLPKGVEAFGRGRLADRENSVLTVYFDDLVEGRSISNFDPTKPLIRGTNTDLVATLNKIGRVIDNASPIDHVLLDALVGLLRVELGATQKVVDQSRVSGTLTAVQARSISEFIDARLNTRVTLKEMSELLGLSEFHFSRAFKKTFTISPYRYLLARRVERAKELLQQAELGIAEVGAMAGFTSSSQFSKTFQALSGVTPRDFRKAVRREASPKSGQDDQTLN